MKSTHNYISYVSFQIMRRRKCSISIVKWKCRHPLYRRNLLLTYSQAVSKAQQEIIISQSWFQLHQLLKESNLGRKSITSVTLVNLSMACTHRWDEDCLHIPAPGPSALFFSLSDVLNTIWKLLLFWRQEINDLSLKLQQLFHFMKPIFANIHGCIGNWYLLSCSGDEVLWKWD